MQLAGGSQRQLGQGTIVFHVEHSGTETVEYGVRATIKVIGLRARSSTWCLKVRLVFQTVRHREVARKAREGRPTYCPSAHPEGGTEGTGHTGRSSSRKRPVCRSVAERVEGTLTMGDQHVPRRGYLAPRAFHQRKRIK